MDANLEQKARELLAELDQYLDGCPDPDKVAFACIVKKPSRLLWRCRETLTRALQAQPAEGGVGFVLVPVEPTAEMLQAGFLCESNGFVIQRPQDAPYHVWKAMIAAFRWRSFAAPKPATTTGEGVG